MRALLIREFGGVVRDYEVPDDMTVIRLHENSSFCGIIQETVLDLCASGRVVLHRHDGTNTWLHEKKLEEFRHLDSITYKYIGCEHGVGIYHEVKS